MSASRFLDRSPAHFRDCRCDLFSIGNAFRVDLDDIGSVLRHHPAIGDAVVVMREDQPGEKRLVAYVTTTETRPSRDELRTHCERRLPGYMLPETFVTLAQLPRTRNGRVDVLALPPPVDADQAAQVPLTRLESQVKKIWEDILGLSSVGLRDDFFKLGGHSLLAVRLFARLEKTLGERLPLSVLFQAPTVEGLARVIRERKRSGTGESLVEIQPHGSRPPIFWLHTLGGGGGTGLFTYQALARHLGPDQPSYGFVAPAEPLAELEAMAAYYIREMRVMEPAGPYYLGGYCFGGVVAYEMARQLREAGTGVALVALIDSVPPNPSGRPGILSAEFLGHFARTTPRWMASSLRQPDELAGKIARHMRRLKQKIEHEIVPGEALAESVALGDVIDMENYPSGFQRHAEAHWRALVHYHPKPFNGRVTLLHTNRPTLLTPSPESDWRRLAREVDVRIVPGTHENILADPQAKIIARILTRILREERNQAAAGSEESRSGRARLQVL